MKTTIVYPKKLLSERDKILKEILEFEKLRDSSKGRKWAEHCITIAHLYTKLQRLNLSNKS